MSTYKRTLSILLSLMMALSMLVLPAFAGEEGDTNPPAETSVDEETPTTGENQEGGESSEQTEGTDPQNQPEAGDNQDGGETPTNGENPEGGEPSEQPASTEDEEQDSDWQYLESMPDDFPKEEFEEQDYKVIKLYRLNGGELTPTAPEKDIKDLYGDYDRLYKAIIDGEIEVFKKGVKYKKLDQEISASDVDVTVRIGETKAIGASAKTDLIYESDDKSVAEVDDEGNIKANEAGTAQITIKAGDDKYYNAAEKTITVTVLNKENQTIKTPNNTYSKRFGQPAFSLGVSAKTKLTYKVTSGSSVAVDSKGKVSIRGTGTAKVTITASETDLYNATQKTVTVKVNPPAAPSLTAKAIGNRKVQLNWSAVPGAVKYQIQPYIDNKSLTAKTVSGRTIKNTGLKRGRQYKYKIRAIVTVNKKTIYSPWSVLRAVRVK